MSLSIKSLFNRCYCFRKAVRLRVNSSAPSAHLCRTQLPRGVRFILKLSVFLLFNFVDLSYAAYSPIRSNRIGVSARAVIRFVLRNFKKSPKRGRKVINTCDDVSLKGERISAILPPDKKMSIS